jgi:hypothetical protein
VDEGWPFYTRCGQRGGPFILELAEREMGWLRRMAALTQQAKVRQKRQRGLDTATPLSVALGQAELERGRNVKGGGAHGGKARNVHAQHG